MNIFESFVLKCMCPHLASVHRMNCGNSIPNEDEGADTLATIVRMWIAYFSRHTYGILLPSRISDGAL